MDSKNQEKKGLEIVTGNAEDLDISPVYTHLEIAKPKTVQKQTKKIVIPKAKK